MATRGYNTQVNFVTSRNIYPFMNGPTLGTLSGAQSDYHSNVDATTEGIMAPVNSTSQGTEEKPKFDPASKPLMTWAVLLGLLIVLMYGVQKFGTSGQKGDFANIKLSAFNILVIAIAATIGITFLKLVFTRFYVPGLSQLVNT